MPGDHSIDRSFAARLTSTIVAIAVAVGTTLVAAGSQAQHFQPQPLLPVPVGALTGPNSFVLADINHDSHLDLIVIDAEDFEVAWLLGDGNGGFAPRMEHVNTVDLDGMPTAVAVADLGSSAGPPDGNPDIVITTDDGDVRILLGNGDGTFLSPDDAQDLSVLLHDANDLEGIVLSNFDSDPAPDLAVLDVGDDKHARVFTLCNRGGIFSTCGTSDGSPIEVGDDINPVDMQFGDFDGDGHTDLVVLSQGGDATPGTFSVLYGDGQGNFSVSGKFPATAGGEDTVPQALAVANLDGVVNGNVRDDVVVANASTFDDRNVAIALSQRRSTFSISAGSIEFNTSSVVALGDVTGSGRIDAVFAFTPIASGGQFGPLLLLNDGAGGFGTSAFFIAGLERVGGGRAVRLGDVGGDNLPDLVMVTDDGENILVAINDSRIASPAPTVPAVSTATPTPIPPTQTATPKFGLSSGCSIADPPGRPPLAAGALLALLSLGSWRRRRALRVSSPR